MTNAEKYKEVFGFPPDEGKCPTESCDFCPCNFNGEFYCKMHNWWDEEYKEVVNNG